MHAQSIELPTPRAHSPMNPDAETAESMRPIRALNRGLEVLTELNRRERATVNLLAKSVRLPRTTTYRILETLRAAGYVERDQSDQSYQPTRRVRALSEGFDDAAMLVNIAKPHMTALCAALVWPIALATPGDEAMHVRAITDRQSPLALDPMQVGVRLAMLGSALGRAYLAFCSPGQREQHLATLAKSRSEDDRLVRDRVELERIMSETRTQGYSITQRARRLSDEVTLAIPVRNNTKVLGSLSVRYSASAVSARMVQEQILPKMRATVASIEGEFTST